MWDNLKVYRKEPLDMRDDFMQEELEEAYRQGCEDGYLAAMEEMDGDMHERRMSHRRPSGFKNAMGYREAPMDERNSGRMGERFGERRHRDSMGRFR